MQHRLYGLRGKKYTAEYVRLFEELQEEIKAEVLRIKNETGKFSAYDLGKICLKFKVPLTAMDAYLNKIFPTDSSDQFKWAIGTWDRMQMNGVKAKDIGVVWD